jgi:hypothetical protein
MVSRKPLGGAVLAGAAVGLALAMPMAARAATDLQAFRATLSPGGTVVDLTEAGPMDWVHWGYQMTGGPFGQQSPPAKSVRKLRDGGGLIGELQVLPPTTTAPPELYWFPKQGTTISFRWTDGTPVLNPGAGVSVGDGVSGVPGTRFVFRAASGPELRQLSIYLGLDCTDLVQVDVTLGARSKRLTSTEICAERFENHKITIRYSSDDRTDLVVTSRGGVFGQVGGTIYAATLAVVAPTGGQQPPDGGAAEALSGGDAATVADAPGGAGDTAGPDGRAGSGGGGSGGGGSGSGGRDAAAVIDTGDPGTTPGGRVLACALGPGGPPGVVGTAHSLTGVIACGLLLAGALARRRARARALRRP